MPFGDEWSWVSFLCGFVCMWLVLGVGFGLLMAAVTRYHAKHRRPVEKPAPRREPVRGRVEA